MAAPEGVGPARSPGLDAVQEMAARDLAPELELLHPLGSGRTAHVFLAREVALQRLVAVKILRPNIGEDDTLRARFVREARSAARISHPCVPTVHRVGRLQEGLPFLIQEYVKGRTLSLRDRLDGGEPVPPGDARRILADLADALAAAHRVGVIHRDVSPGNVIIGEKTGRAVLTDFGIAAFRESGVSAATRLRRDGEILGNPRYSSPEQLRGGRVT